jgi:hypothetical protein
MLDSKLKNLRLISSFIGHEGVSIIEKYDRQALHPMLLKCYHHLQPMA